MMHNTDQPMTIMDEMTSCTGCGACMSICPVGAIGMLPRPEGFLYPEISQEACVRCGACRRVCPVNRADLRAAGARMPDAQLREDPPVFACWSDDGALRLESSSGGAFGTLARTVIRDGGIVFGAVFDNPKHVCHRGAGTEEQLRDLLRSKYVQSETGTVFHQVEDALAQHRQVLFCGTPCQVAGLKSYLEEANGARKDPDGSGVPGLAHGGRPPLLTCDFVCSGVPSPLVWKLHVEALERRRSAQISRVSFRSKSRGWRRARLAITYENGRTEETPLGRDPFFIGFGKELFNRPACAQCRFRTRQSAADLTLGDYWGIWKAGADHPAFTDNKGVSLLVTQTREGEWLLGQSGGALHHVRRTYREAESGNPRMTTSRAPSPQRGAFFKAIQSGQAYESIARVYMDNTSLAYHVKALVRRLLPSSMLQRVYTLRLRRGEQQR